jgi:hypothetical protein
VFAGHVHLQRRLKRHAAAGAAATVVMSLPMLVRWALQRQAPPPPMVVAENLQHRLGLKPERYPRTLRHAIWSGAHVGFGAAVGALSVVWPRRVTTVTAAHSFGAAVWSANYALALPLAGLYPWPWSDDRQRAAETAISHAIYAAALRRLVRTA